MKKIRVHLFNFYIFPFFSQPLITALRNSTYQTVRKSSHFWLATIYIIRVFAIPDDTFISYSYFIRVYVIPYQKLQDILLSSIQVPRNQDIPQLIERLLYFKSTCYSNVYILIGIVICPMVYLT